MRSQAILWVMQRGIMWGDAYSQTIGLTLLGYFLGRQHVHLLTQQCDRSDFRLAIAPPLPKVNCREVCRDCVL